MIGKVTIGSSFAGVVRYVMQKPEARLIHGEGIRMEKLESMIEDFNMQRKLNPDLNRAVGHIALSWSKYDAEKLSREIMMERAKEYMQKMKISDTQYLLVEHRDKNRPHVHLIYNRVNNEGKTISDQFQKGRNQKVCKDMTLKYSYYLGKDKSQVNRQRLTGADKIKYELYDAIKAASVKAQSWAELKAALKNQKIEIIFKYKVGTSEIEGISFARSGIQFKGSKIDRSMSFGNLDALIRQNQKHLVLHQLGTQPVYQSGLAFERDQPGAFRQMSQNDHFLEDLFKPIHPTGQPAAITFKKRKKRKQYLGHSL